jgi:hypothetical protein
MFDLSDTLQTILEPGDLGNSDFPAYFTATSFT